jgi:hypothetical protein
MLLSFPSRFETLLGWYGRGIDAKYHGESEATVHRRRGIKSCPIVGSGMTTETDADPAMVDPQALGSGS